MQQLYLLWFRICGIQCAKTKIACRALFSCNGSGFVLVGKSNSWWLSRRAWLRSAWFYILAASTKICTQFQCQMILIRWTREKNMMYIHVLHQNRAQMEERKKSNVGMLAIMTTEQEWHPYSDWMLGSIFMASVIPSQRFQLCDMTVVPKMSEAKLHRNRHSCRCVRPTVYITSCGKKITLWSSGRKSSWCFGSCLSSPWKYCSVILFKLCDQRPKVYPILRYKLGSSEIVNTLSVAGKTASNSFEIVHALHAGKVLQFVADEEFLT